MDRPNIDVNGLAYSVGTGVYGFTLDPNVDAFVLSNENIRMPEQRILDIVPTEVYQRTPFIVGSKVEMERLGQM